MIFNYNVGSVEDHSDDKSDPGVVGAIQVPGSSEWMFKRRSVCLPPAGPGQSGLGPGSHNTSFALSPSVHSRDIQQPGECSQQLAPVAILSSSFNCKC